jgi:hypothetical protein
VIFDGDFHIDFSGYGSWNVGCYNIIEIGWKFVFVL